MNHSKNRAENSISNNLKRLLAPALVSILVMNPAFAEKESGTIKTGDYTTICDKKPKACGGSYGPTRPHKPTTPPVVKESTSSITTRTCPDGTVVADSQRCLKVKTRFSWRFMKIGSHYNQ